MRGRGKKTRQADELHALEVELKSALKDAATLQAQSKVKRDVGSYISEMKLVSTRIAAIQGQIERAKDTTVQTLKDEITKLKAEVGTQKAEIAASREREKPAEPEIAPRPWEIELKRKREEEKNAKVEKAEKATEPTTLERVQQQRDASPQVVAPAPTRLPDISGVPEHVFASVRLTPPRASETLALPRPVVPPSEPERKACESMGSQFPSDDMLDREAARIKAESRAKYNAMKLSVD